MQQTYFLTESFQAFRTQVKNRCIFAPVPVAKQRRCQLFITIFSHRDIVQKILLAKGIWQVMHIVRSEQLSHPRLHHQFLSVASFQKRAFQHDKKFIIIMTVRLDLLSRFQNQIGDIESNLFIRHILLPVKPLCHKCSILPRCFVFSFTPPLLPDCGTVSPDNESRPVS